MRPSDPRVQLDDTAPRPPRAARHPVTKPMEIPMGRARWLRGLIAFVLLLAGVAGLMVWMFLWFTPSVALSVTLVCVMLAYMIGFGWLISRADARS